VLWSIADFADRSPLEYLWVSDHIVWWHPMYESLTLLAALAARTQRIRIGTAVLLLAMRNPVVVAKTLASIERLSRGRVTVGVGVGGEFPPEWKAVGVDPKIRPSMTDEMIEALRGLWNGPFAYNGKRVRFDEIDLHPKPSAIPPIWIGGRKDAALRRAGRLGDGWMGIFTTAERFPSQLELARSVAEEHGRDPSVIVPSLYVWTCVAETDEEARATAETILPAFYNVPFAKLEKYAVFGTPKHCAERFVEFADAGVEHFAVAPITVGDGLDPLRHLIEDVAPLVG
jgi:probable F420-dependent oxidoreductase